MTVYVAKVSINEVGDQTRLIEAKTKAKALAHVAESHITIEVATSAQCVELGAAGVKIEAA